MDFTDNGLVLTRQEAKDLAEVFSITAGLYDWGSRSEVVREPSDEERNEARELSRRLTPMFIDDAIFETVTIIEPHNFTSVTKIAELALKNSQKVVSGLCTPNVCDGYRSEWRPAAYRILAMTAEVSETLKLRT